MRMLGASLTLPEVAVRRRIGGATIAAPDAPTLSDVGGLTTNDSTPDWDIVFATAPVAGDVLKWLRSGSAWGSHTITQPEIDAGTFTDYGMTALSEGANDITLVHSRAGADSVPSNTVTRTLDSTAPTLSSPSAAASGSTAGSGAVTTGEGNGSLFWVVVPSAATAPSAAQIIAGTDGSGNPATSDNHSSPQAVSGTGAQTVASMPGLTASTAYKVYYCQRDAAGNPSNVVTASFTTTSTPVTLFFSAAGLANYGATAPSPLVSGAAIGNPASFTTRYVLFSLTLPYNTPTVTDITFNGVSVIGSVQQDVGSGSSFNLGSFSNRTLFVYGAVATGTTVDVEVTFSSSPNSTADGNWSVHYFDKALCVNGAPTVSFANTGNTAATSISTTLNTGADGFLVSVMLPDFFDGGATWTSGGSETLTDRYNISDTHGAVASKLSGTSAHAPATVSWSWSGAKGATIGAFAWN